MPDILVVLLHSIVTGVRLIKPGGLHAVIAESALTRHQLLISNRSRKRAPNLRVSDRMIAGLCTLLMHPARILRCGIVLKPLMLLHFHHVLTKRKCLFVAITRSAGPSDVRFRLRFRRRRWSGEWRAPRANRIQSGFSCASRRTRTRISSAIRGRPPRDRDFQRQYSRNPARCHLTTV
jgi:hypothetical protein